MAFLEQRLDTKITAGAKSVVRWSRQKAYTGSGRLTQQFNWAHAKHEMDVSHGVRSRADFQAVLDLFYVVMANAYEGFRVKDWRDYQATQLNSVVSDTGDSPTEWQLQRKHVIGAASYLRDITKPVSATVVVYRTRAAVVSVATATVTYTTGRVAISGHQTGDTYTWEGEFDVPMTFVNDEWTADLEVGTVNLFVTSQPILLEEIRL